jgi:DNA-binding NarL/FixJ family response regulator
MPEQLSPLQRQIARALWNGADAGEISRRFSRSLYRVERQMEAIFTAFGVSSRAALHGEAVRRGLA